MSRKTRSGRRRLDRRRPPRRRSPHSATISTLGMAPEREPDAVAGQRLVVHDEHADRRAGLRHGREASGWRPCRPDARARDGERQRCRRAATGARECFEDPRPLRVFPSDAMPGPVSAIWIARREPVDARADRDPPALGHPGDAVADRVLHERLQHEGGNQRVARRRLDVHAKRRADRRSGSARCRDRGRAARAHGRARTSWPSSPSRVRRSSVPGGRASRPPCAPSQRRTSPAIALSVLNRKCG